MFLHIHENASSEATVASPHSYLLDLGQLPVYWLWIATKLKMYDLHLCSLYIYTSDNAIQWHDEPYSIETRIDFFKDFHSK